MPSPEIQAYLAARNARYAVEEAFFADGVMAAPERGLDGCDAMVEAQTAQFDALKACVPARVASRITTGWLKGFGDTHAVLLEDEFVWFPLLVDEFDGNQEAAEVAWHLGQRPNGYPEDR